jgi:hypothetical protein
VVWGKLGNFWQFTVNLHCWHKANCKPTVGLAGDAQPQGALVHVTCSPLSGLGQEKQHVKKVDGKAHHPLNQKCSFSRRAQVQIKQAGIAVVPHRGVQQRMVVGVGSSQRPWYGENRRILVVHCQFVLLAEGHHKPTVGLAGGAQPQGALVHATCSPLSGLGQEKQHVQKVGVMSMLANLSG